jgi:FMN-dependent NADH-azoreductase
MASLLYVTCNVRPQDRSRTLSLGYEFLEEYLNWNPQDEVQILDLYRDSIQRADQDVLNAWGRIERGEDYVLLSDEERRKVSRLWRLADQFGRCDKYVFVTHSLNLWFPAEFKMYMDAICVPNRTFRFTPRGAEGMLPGESKKSIHLHARAPFRYGTEADLSVPYLRSVLNFLGVKEQETVVVAGDNPEVDVCEDYEMARRRLMDLALTF